MELPDSVRQDYEILATVDLAESLVRPYNWLYQQLTPLYREYYSPRQRLTLMFNGFLPPDLADHLQQILFHLDISNWFVLLITTDGDADVKLSAARDRWNPGEPSVGCVVVPGEAAVLPQTTNFALPESLCMAPWTRLEVQPNGVATLCCAISSSVRDDDGNEFDVTKHSLDQIYHSNWLKNLRNEFLYGQRPKVCDQCWNDEKNSNTSIRQHIGWDLKSQKFAIDWYQPDVKQIRSLSLATDNTCNLKCRTCSPLLSSAWSSELLAELPQASRADSKPFEIIVKSQQVKNSERFWDDVWNLSDDLVELNFIGGEPMLSKRYFDIVGQLNTTNKHKKIKLRYTTNGTVFPDQAIDLWADFGSVEISISIDDIGDRFEYQRSGASWSMLCENLRKYQDLATNRDTFVIKCHSTVNNQNIFYLPELCDWIEQQRFDHVRLNVLYHPWELSIRHLPRGAVVAVKEKFAGARWGPSVESQITSVLNFIENTDPVDDRIFVEFLKPIDRRRNEHYADAHPEMAKLVNYCVD